jgi:CubicO group peptidase (beta-lactamase class C family)
MAVASVLFCGHASLKAAPSPADSDIQTMLRECVDEDKRTPGIAAGWLDAKGGRVMSYGTRDGNAPVDGNTVFEIGSVTKTFTATVLELMVEQGEVTLDDPAQKFLPPSVKIPSRDGKQITLRDLATHTSALPRLPSNMKPKDAENPYADYTVEQLYEFLKGCKLARDIGAKYEYSNLGVGLLGHILALKAGTNYEALVMREICRPLKMDSTRITLTPELKARLAVGHNQAGAPVGNWDIPTLAGAGALRSTANDMLKYLSANIGLSQVPLAQTMAKAQVIQAPAGSAEMSIALAWHVTRRFGSEIIWHNGGTGGYHTFVGFDRTNQQGVVVLSNSSTDIDDIGRHLLNPSYKINHPRARQIAKIDYKVYADYVGQYELIPGIRFTITREGDHLFAQLTSQQRFEVYPESETNFFYTVVDAQLTFERKDGEVADLILHQNGRDQTATKMKDSK